jgi:hypothetical protein
MAKERIKTEKL